MKSERDLDRPGGRDAVAVGRGSVPVGVAVDDGSQIDLADAAATINHPSISLSLPHPQLASSLHLVSSPTVLPRPLPTPRQLPPPASPTNFAPRCCVGNICSVLSCPRRSRLQPTRNKQLLCNTFSRYHGRRSEFSCHFLNLDVNSDFHTLSAVAVATITKRIYSACAHVFGTKANSTVIYSELLPWA